MNKISDTFCILPWIHMASYTDGSALLCCVASSRKDLNFNVQTPDEIWNSKHFRQARRLMIAGRWVKECAACYKLEHVGIYSHRQIENHIWEKKLGEEYINELVNETKSDGSIESKWITLDLRLGNTCNLQCVMCRPIDSSKWVKHAIILKEELTTDAKWDWKHKVEKYSTNNFDWYKNEKFLKDFYDSADDIRHLIFGGGEPLYIKEHKEILQNLVESGNSHHIELRYHTNGSIYDEEVVELWTKFKFVEVMISIDGAKEVNDYIRYPSNWSVIEENLKRYDNTPSMIDVKILCTVQMLNVYFLPELVNWLFVQNFKKISRANLDGTFHPGMLHYPKYLCIKALPKEIKNKVSEKLHRFAEANTDNPSIQRMLKVVDFMNGEDWSDVFDQTIEYIDKLDELRGTDNSFFKDVINVRTP